MQFWGYPMTHCVWSNRADGHHAVGRAMLFGFLFAVAITVALGGCAVSPPSAPLVEASSAARQDEAQLYAEDSNHPIPRVNVIDVSAYKPGSQPVLGMIIASPLEADERSMKRLTRKFENYLAYAHSPEHTAKAGGPVGSATLIDVRIDDGSSPAVFALLEWLKALADENNATLVVNRWRWTGEGFSMT